MVTGKYQNQFCFAKACMVWKYPTQYNPLFFIPMFGANTMAIRLWIILITEISSISIKIVHDILNILLTHNAGSQIISEKVFHSIITQFHSFDVLQTRIPIPIADVCVHFHCICRIYSFLHLLIEGITSLSPKAMEGSWIRQLAHYWLLKDWARAHVGSIGL